jgi:6-phosphofructokinase 1
MSDMLKFNKIGVLTSGGDAPGMNAAIRAITRAALFENKEVAGIRRGYQGLIDDDIIPLTKYDVSGILGQGGTILKTARCKEFHTREGRQRAYDVLKAHSIDALIVIGGDGSFKGAAAFAQEHDIPVIGIPGTIDNDIYGTEYTIGYDTALNTVVEAVDKIRDTANAMNRIFFVEVMGKESGFLALQSAIACGAEGLMIPEISGQFESLCNLMKQRGNVHKSSIIIVAEGETEGSTFEIAEKFKKEFPESDVKTTILGHIQRGGSPTAFDRIISSRMGNAAVEALLHGQKNVMIGIVKGSIVQVPLDKITKIKKEVDKELLHLNNILK